MTPDLFDAAGVQVEHVKTPHIQRAQGRKLLGMVEAMLADATPTYHDKARAAESYARRIGAHSVARAICWGTSLAAIEYHGIDHVEITVEKAARRYLGRIERP